MSAQFTCTVNAVGPTSGDFEMNFLDPRDDPTTHGPAIVITLTDLGGAFNGFSFLVDGSIGDGVLAVGLAAISTGNQVMADVDWPQPIIGKDQGGDTIYGAAYCRSLWLNNA
ncbi:MAG: hypothetical protein JO263_07535 [Candidatus Eremiobacteraeota bacterium]|nr:hypothetical protein [Candidatus Eremiobacteraeota bacterium]